MISFLFLFIFIFFFFFDVGVLELIEKTAHTFLRSCAIHNKKKKKLDFKEFHISWSCFPSSDLVFFFHPFSEPEGKER